MIPLLARLVSFFLLPRSLRERVRHGLIFLLYGIPVWRRAQKVGKGLHCGGPVHVTRKTVLADHVSFNGAFFFGGGPVSFGRWSHSGVGLKVFTRNHDYNTGNAIPYGDKFVVKPVEVGDFVWIGAEVILLPGTKIGEGAIIQAGSVVHGEIPPMAIAGGNPAKVFAWRDAEHFNRLKAEGRFR